MWWLIFACNSGDERQAEFDAVGSQQSAPIEHPMLELNTPSRTEFIAENEIALKGLVAEGSSSLSTLKVNGDAVSFAGNSFDATVSGRPGVNILNLRLEAEDRGRAVDSVGVYVGPYLDKEAQVESGARLQISQELIDDGDPDLDDLASIAEELVNNLDLVAVLGGPFVLDGREVTINELTQAGVDLSIECGDTLLITATLDDLYLDAQVNNWDGIVTVEQILLELSLQFYVEDGEVVVYVVDRDIELVGVDTDGWLIWGFGWLEDFIVGLVQSEIETAIGDQIQSLLEELVADYLNNFALDVEFFSGVNLSASVASLGVAEEGLRMELDAGLQGEFIKLIPNFAGSARIADTAPYWPISTTRPFAVAVSGDLINQLMFATWGTGYFGDIEVDGTLLQAVSGGPIPEPLGPVDTVVINIDLPPSVYPSDQEDMTGEIAIGEWQLLLTRTDGEIIDFRINLQAGLQAFFEDGEVRFAIDGRPATIDLGVATVVGPEELDKGDLSALGKLVIPPLIGAMASFLPTVELPPIPLSAVSEELPDLNLTEADITMTSNSWLLIEADVE